MPRRRGSTVPTFTTDPLEYEVTEGPEDQNPPTVSSVSLSSREVATGADFHISWTVSDADGVRSVSPYCGRAGRIRTTAALFRQPIITEARLSTGLTSHSTAIGSEGTG